MGFPAGAPAAVNLAGSAVSAAVLAATQSTACAQTAWNSIAPAIPDKAASFTLVNLGALVCSIPLVVLAAPPPRAAGAIWPPRWSCTWPTTGC